jgi:hypothetical protein
MSDGFGKGGPSSSFVLAEDHSDGRERLGASALIEAFHTLG